MYSSMYRQTTPPSATHQYVPDSANSQALSNGSFWDSSPESVMTNNTALTTPPRSPIRQHGPLLLPKIRSQDQTMEPSHGPIRHKRNSSTHSINYAQTFNPYSRPGFTRRSTSPSNYSDLLSPATDGAVNSALNSPIEFPASQPMSRGSSMSRRPSLAHARSQSTSAIRQHSRSGSISSIDDSVIARFGYPTYRSMPQYRTAATVAQPSLNIVTTGMTNQFPQASGPQMSHISTVSQWSQPSSLSQVTTCNDDYVLPPELQWDAFTENVETTTLLDYLTSPNPSPALVRRVTTLGRGLHMHFWWDVRNLRSWTDFNIETITTIPGLLDLLNIPVSSMALPEPARPNMQPDSEAALHDITRDFHAAKVNAALKVAQGNSHMAMRALKQQPGTRQQPEFVSNYQSDYEKTIFGDGRGRVVGLVKAYDQWNTGMRSEAPNKQVYYLQGLAHLHRVMREHGCRYGFIMTEIELLCVRCGGPSNSSTTEGGPVQGESTNGIPLFGFLELSAPINLSKHGLNSETGEPQMTAGLALWYLHMLAKEAPLPGMGSWRMDVGGPAALTRQNITERDDWMPKPQISEKREAKRLRGWVFPEEPLSRKEVGRGKRSRTRS